MRSVAPVRVQGVGDPSRGTHVAVDGQGMLEMVDGTLVVAERRSQQAEIPVRGAVARHTMADHDISAGQRGQRGI